jgi:hypothetical protein
LPAVFKYGLLILLAFCTSPATQASQLNLLVNGKAIHLGVPTGKTMNEKNWGLGLQYDFTPINEKWVPFTTISGFIDSMNQPSYYAGGGLLRRFPVGHRQGEVLNLDAGIIAFLMTRDDYKNSNPFPGILPAFSFGTRKAAINLTYIPKVHPKLIPLWFLQLKFAL